jgi:aromatic-amino-acid transaminase
MRHAFSSHLIPGHLHRPSDDPIFALNKEASARKARGEAVINASIGTLLSDDGRLAILPTAAKAVHEIPAEEWAAYAPIAGSTDFLNAVIADLFRDEPAMRECAVAAATPGGTGALRHAIANYLEPGQSLLTTSFFWGPYLTLADEADRKVATFAMFDPHGRLDIEALDKKLASLVEEQKRVLLFLNDPCHNPTGYSMRDDEWRAVVDRLIAHAERSDASITLLVDMAYAAYNARDPRAFLKELRPLLGKVGLLFAWSASKTFTHYGLRVGAIVACEPDAAARAETEAALCYSCRGTWSNVSRGGMKAITRLLTDASLAAACDRERDELKALLGGRVAAFNEIAPKHGLRYPRYEGGFFVTVFADDAQDRAARAKERGIFIVPQKGAMRVALCSVPSSDIPRLVEALAT